MPELQQFRHGTNYTYTNGNERTLDLDAGTITAIANVGGNGLIAFLFVWFITKRQPAQEQQYRQDLEKIASDFKEELRLERASREQSRDMFVKAMTDLSSNTLKSFEQILNEVEHIKDGRSRTR